MADDDVVDKLVEQKDAEGTDAKTDDTDAKVGDTDAAKAGDTDAKGADTEGAKPKGKKSEVPVGALTAEREKYRKQVQDLEGKLARYDQLEQRLNQFYEEQRRAKEQAAAPKYEEDPAAYLRWQQEQLAKRTEDLDKKQQEQSKLGEREQELRQITARIRAAEAEFTTQNKDYYDALKFVRAREVDRLKLLGFDHAQALQALEQGELQIAAWLVTQERNPAQYVYELAKWSGYQSPQDKQAGAEKEIDTLENKLKAAGTLGSGSAPAKEDFGRMPMPEFEAAMKEMFGR